VVDQKWFNNGTSSTTDEFKYGYDWNGNPLYRTNEVNHNLKNTPPEGKYDPGRTHPSF
jgi:hypothetical protein